MAVAEAPVRPERRPQHPVISPAMMGMYIFLASEVMFFGSLFAMYFYMFGSHPLGWPPPRTIPINWWPLPAANTVILLSSGVTCHYALDSIAHDQRPRFFVLLVSTILLGVAFEVGQGYEFTHAHISFSGLNQFGSAFFTMTGFHGLHVAGGLVFLLLMLGRALRGHFNGRHHVGFAAATLYWHFVDVVWIFLFGILYLAVTAV
ncbi:MAG TPA: heme-copper oxidase subunit III [Candidatus Dormibacteraeota bacterium]|nr:heme-copper oxidase subunit III [Candidatus Dormibacteraeota bacterium]